MYVTADIEIDTADIVQDVIGHRDFTGAVIEGIENADLQDAVEAAFDNVDVQPAVEQAIEQAVEAMDLPTKDDVDSLVRDILRDEGLLRESQVTIQMQARVEALEAQVAHLQTVLRDIANVINPQPVRPTCGGGVEIPVTASDTY